MARNMNVTEVRARLLALLDEVADGEEIEITRHGHTVARLVPAKGPHSLKGLLKGVAITSAGDDDLFTTSARWDIG